MYQTGYIRDTYDGRDIDFRGLVGSPAPNLPSRVMLEGIIGPPFDQGTTSECVAYSASAIKRYHEYKQSEEFLTFDAHDLYTRCKAVDGYPNHHGTMPRVAMRLLQEEGMKCDEFYYKIATYARLLSVDDIRNSLHTQGPVLLAIRMDMQGVSALGMSPNNVIAKTTSFTGAHAMVAVGYDDNSQLLRIRNSWGKDWGEDGHCWLPYEYLTECDAQFDAWGAVDLR